MKGLSIALGAGALFLGLALAVREIPTDGEVNAQAQLAQQAEVLTALTEQLSQIGARLERVEARARMDFALPPPADPESSSKVAELDDSVKELVERIEQIESTEHAGTDEEALKILDKAFGLGGQKPYKPKKEWVAEHQNTLRNPRLTDDERISALRRLRGVPKDLKPHEAVVGEIIDWMEDTQSSSIREDIIRQLHGAEVVDLVTPLLHYLANDPSSGVREEAAETLDDYLAEPGVRAALLHAAENDNSGKVRRIAYRSLGGGKR